MLYYMYWLSQGEGAYTFLRLFRYVTFRAGGAFFTAFIIAVLLGPAVIRVLKRLQAIAPSRLGEYLPEQLEALEKRVPSMGGLLILYAIVMSVLLWAVPTNPLIHVFLFLLLALGAVGFADDYMKISNQASRAGMSGRTKLLLQVLIGAVAVYWLDLLPETNGMVRDLMVPFYKYPVAELSLALAVAFGCLVVVGSSNAVNLTDGMDGLASGCTVVTALAFAALAYISGHAVFAEYLGVPFIPGASEVVVLTTAIAGAALGFLWHNCHPASMFMGDTGSLSLGGAIGLTAVLVKQELVLPLIGAVFVLEALSVILQVGYYKGTRWLFGSPQRLFLCAPIHHHFQQKGWTETQVVTRFWIVAVLVAAFGLATLKLR